MKLVPLKGGIEQDYLTRFRKLFSGSNKTKKYAERKYNKRVRRTWKQEVRDARWS